MKTSIVFFFTLTSFLAMSQSSDELAIKQLIIKFENATAKQNVDLLDPLLNSEFRVAMNQLFGSTELAIMNRATYVQKIQDKVFGGESREIDILQQSISGNTAMAVVLLKGEKMTIKSMYSMAKNKNGQWQLVQDFPSIIQP